MKLYCKVSLGYPNQEQQNLKKWNINVKMKSILIELRELNVKMKDEDLVVFLLVSIVFILRISKHR